MASGLGRALALVLVRAAYMLLAPFDAAARSLMVTRPQARVSGFAMFVRSEHISPNAAVAKLSDALGLLAAHDPRRTRRIRTDVPRLVVMDQLHAGTYWTHPRAIVLDGKTVQQQPPLWVAAAIVHESTHVRLRRAGIRTTNDNRARIERRCVGEQIAFLETVASQDSRFGAQAQYYIDGCMDALDSPTPWYDPDQKWRRAREALVAENIPPWLLRLFDRLRPSRVEGAPDGGA